MRDDFHRSQDSFRPFDDLSAQTPRRSRSIPSLKKRPRNCYQAPDGDQLWKLLLVVAIYQIRQNCPDLQMADSDLQRAISDLQAQDCEESDGSARDLFSNYLELVLESILERLPPHHRMIVALRLDGCEVAEAARLIRRSTRSVERILHESGHMLASLINER
jgi:hypothetical protein